MKKIALLLLFVSSVCSAQFAVTSGRSGLIEVRESASPDSDVVARLDNGSGMYCFEEKAGWIPVDFVLDGLIASGFARKSDLRMISDFESIPYSYSNEHKTILQKGDVRVILTEMDFNPKGAVFEVDGESGLYRRINGKEFFGTDGTMPTRQYGFIDVMIGSDRISLPQEATDNLFQPTLESSTANYDSVNDILYITASNSDGAGGYEVIWVIEKRKYKNRCVFYGF